MATSPRAASTGGMHPPNSAYRPPALAVGSAPLASPSPRRVTKMSSSWKRESLTLAGPSPALALGGTTTGGLTPSLAGRVARGSNPATPLFSPDTDAAFAALASKAPGSTGAAALPPPPSAAKPALPPPPPSVAKPAAAGDRGATGGAGVSPWAVEMAKAARLAQQAARKDSPSAEEARDLSAQLEAAAGRNRLSSGGGAGGTQSARGAEAAAPVHAAAACASAQPPRTSPAFGGAERMFSPPAAERRAAGQLGALLSPPGGSSSRRKPQSGQRWNAAVTAPSPAEAAPRHAVEIVESIAVSSEASTSFISPRPASTQATDGALPETPAQQDDSAAAGSSLSPSGKYWKQMRTEEHAAAELMGWTEETWDTGDRAPFKEVWMEMSELKQRAAIMFKFGPELFAKAAKLQAWAGHEGWTYKRGIGLITFVYVAPDGHEFTSQAEAQQSYDAAGGSSSQEAFSPQRRSPLRSPILSPNSSKVCKSSTDDGSDPSATDGDYEVTEGAYWWDMNKLQQTAAEMLGWNVRTWDDGDDTVFKKVWVEMTADEQSAAFALNFDEGHFEKKKKQVNKRGHAWAGHVGWWIKRGSGLVNWIYTAPDDHEFTDEQDALAAATLSEDGPQVEAIVVDPEVKNLDGVMQKAAAEHTHTQGQDEDEEQEGNADSAGTASRTKRKRDQHPQDSLTSPAGASAGCQDCTAPVIVPSPKAVGEHIEANYKQLGKYHGGVIKTENPDGTFAVSYHDGDFEESVDRGHIRALRKRRRVPRTDLDVEQEEKDAAHATAVAAAAEIAAEKAAEKAAKDAAKAKARKLARKPELQGPTAAERKRVAQNLRVAAEGVATSSDRSMDETLGWLWKALVNYKGEPASGMELLKHIATSGGSAGGSVVGSSVRRHSALFSPSANRRGSKRGAAAASSAGTPLYTKDKDFMWERLDGGKWRMMPDSTWQRDGLVVLWTPTTRETLPDLEQVVFELKCGEAAVHFRGTDGDVRQGRQGKEECFTVISEAALRDLRKRGGQDLAEVVVWNGNGTPDPMNDSGIKMEDTFAGLPLEPREENGEEREGSFPPAGGLLVDMLCDAQDNAGGWNHVKVKEQRDGTDGPEVKVHFMGWNERHDKWMSVGSGQLAPAETMSNDQESATRHQWNGRRDSGGGSSPDSIEEDNRDEEDEDAVEIALILQERLREDGATEYKVRFKGETNATGDTWVDEAEIQAMEAEDKVTRFREKEEKKAERKAALVRP